MMRTYAVYGSLRTWLGKGWNAAMRWPRRFWEGIAKWWFQLPLVVWINKNWPGWELGVIFAILLAACTFVGNLVFLIVATVQHAPGPSGLGTLREGECKQIDWNNKVAHAFINVVSTVCIQRLAML
jgi:hypothetical protein